MRSTIFTAPLLALLLAAPAQADTTVDATGGRLRVLAAAGKTNDILVMRVNPVTYRVFDAGDRVVAGAGCVGVNTNSADCPVAGITRAGIAAGDLDDDVSSTVALRDVLIAGGDGDDALLGGGRLDGGGGDDTLRGSGTENVLDGGPGADVLEGLGGTTVADYSARTAPVYVALDGLAEDGEAGEGDEVRSTVEVVRGGLEDDVLKGHSGVNQLEGGPGDDQLTGLGRPDILIGGPGDDLHDGGDSLDRFIAEPADGADRYVGGSGADEVTYAVRTAPLIVDLDGVDDDGEIGERDNVEADVERVVGGAGNDALRGNGAENRLSGGEGRDALNGLGGDDWLDGGPGGDALSGGSDQDSVSYQRHTVPVFVDPDGVADDGGPNERDNVGTDVEDLIGGPEADTLIGSAGPNYLNGITGSDRLIGLDGADTLVGHLGDDTLLGGRGDDDLYDVDLVAGNDALHGDADTDTCASDAGDTETGCEL
jgi:Ca2+-binding RTX toxin-like protein